MHGGSLYEDFRLDLSSCFLLLLRSATSHFGFTLRASVSLWLVFAPRFLLERQSQEPCSIGVVHLLQNRLWQTEAIDLPSALWRHRRRSIVEILVLGL